MTNTTAVTCIHAASTSNGAHQFICDECEAVTGVKLPCPRTGVYAQPGTCVVPLQDDEASAAWRAIFPLRPCPACHGLGYVHQDADGTQWRKDRHGRWTEVAR